MWYIYMYFIWQSLAGSHWAIIMDVSSTSDIFISIFMLFYWASILSRLVCKHQMMRRYSVLSSVVLMEKVYTKDSIGTWYPLWGVVLPSQSQDFWWEAEFAKSLTFPVSIRIRKTLIWNKSQNKACSSIFLLAMDNYHGRCSCFQSCASFGSWPKCWLECLWTGNHSQPVALL